MLTEKYKPLQVSEFVGLEKPKKIIGKFVKAAIARAKGEA